MQIEINGQPRELPTDTTVMGLLDLLAIGPMGTVVERNGQIVDREAFACTTLTDRDRLELVRLVGGG